MHHLKMSAIYFAILSLLLLASCASKHIPVTTEFIDPNGIEITIQYDGPNDSIVVRPVHGPDYSDPYYTYRMEMEQGRYEVFVPKWRPGMPIDRTHGQRPMMPKGERFGDTFDYNIVVYKDGNGTVYPKKGYYSCPSPLTSLRGE